MRNHTRYLGARQARTELSALLKEVEADGEVVIMRRGRPVARLIREHQAERRSRKSGEELVAAFRELRERIADEWQGDPDFDWKAAVEEGRK